MSTELAVSAVSRAIRDLMISGVKLDDGLVPLGITKGLEHTILPLDRVRHKHPQANVINVFLYRVHASAAYKNLTFSGRTPLALNLEYLITAYGEEDRDEVGHFLLGQAMRVLHDHAVIARSDLRAALQAARVQDQLENLRITLQDFPVEELSKLWTAFQTHYRISASYLVTVLLIDSKVPVPSPLPVLKRGEADTGWDAQAGAPPELDGATPASGFKAVRVGESLIVSGANLDTTGLSAVVRHPLVTRTLDVTPIDSGRVKVKIDDTMPNPSSVWAAGIYSIALKVSRPSKPAWLTNEVPFALAPSITAAPATQSGPNVPFDLTINATPQIRDVQPVVVVFGDQQVTVPPGTIPPPAGPNAPSIVKVKVQGPLGLYRVRLRVDGVESIPIVPDGNTFKFDDAQSVQVTP